MCSAQRRMWMCSGLWWIHDTAHGSRARHGSFRMLIRPPFLFENAVTKRRLTNKQSSFNPHSRLMEAKHKVHRHVMDIFINCTKWNFILSLLGKKHLRNIFLICSQSPLDPKWVWWKIKKCNYVQRRRAIISFFFALFRSQRILRVVMMLLFLEAMKMHSAAIKRKFQSTERCIAAPSRSSFQASKRRHLSVNSYKRSARLCNRRRRHQERSSSWSTSQLFA